MLNYLVLAILIAVAAYLFLRWRGSISTPAAGDPGSATADTSARMPTLQFQSIVAYLLLLGLALVYMEVSLLSLDFPDAPTVLNTTPPPPASNPNKSANPTEGTPAPTPTPHPIIENVLPQSLVGLPNMWVIIRGRDFSNKPQVHVNGRTTPIKDPSATSVSAELTPSDFVSGTAVIHVVDEQNLTSDPVTLQLPPRKPTVKLNVLNIWHPDINREIQLLLIVVFAGALGSFIHLLKSATAFIGNGTMKSSWFWWYISGPFVGMAMALVFYAVLRGGFLAGTPADEKVVNAFGVLTVGALVGMFADKAALKLADIFDTLFKSGDPRSGKLDAPVIVSLDPKKIQAGQSTPQMVKIIGERLGKVSVIRFNSTDVKAEVVSDREVHFTLQPKDLEKARILKVVAVTPEGGASISADLAIVGPKITAPPKLPPATANTAYDQTITAENCAPPCRWSIKAGGNSGGLNIDQASGKLSGTPPATGTFSFTVRLDDANQQSDEKTYELVVN